MTDWNHYHLVFKKITRSYFEIKHIELYALTKSEFGFSMIPPSKRHRNVGDLNPGSVNCETRAGDAPRALDA
jgi:hypothetical protein